MQTGTATHSPAHALPPLRAAQHRDYCRFVILGRTRADSNLLRELLNAHPRAVAFGDLFRHGEIGWDLPDAPDASPELLTLSRRDPVRFLEHEVFRPYAQDVAAVGFKLFYHQADDGTPLEVWPYLQERQDLRLIHVQRANTLHHLVAEKRATSAPRWTTLFGESEPAAAVTLDYDECLHMFRRVQEEKAQVARLFPRHARLDVFYEQLAVNPCAEMTRIQRFLNLPAAEVPPCRVDAQTLTQSISNYAALKRRFQGTPWAEFFNE